MAREPQVLEGTICYPPVLGIEPAADGHGARARLANTLATVTGESVTVVFRGDRAEVAEQFLVRGSAVRLLGVWDDDLGELRVDRFDIAEVHEDHKYRLAGRRAGAVAGDVDVSTLYDPPPTGPSPEPVAPAVADHTAAAGGDPVGAGRPVEGGRGVGRFVPGQRVVARDRGNVGTVVSVDEIPDRVRVRFAGRDGREAVIAFTSHELDPAPTSPTRPQAGHVDWAADDRDGWPAPAEREPPSGWDSDTIGPPAAGDAPVAGVAGAREDRARVEPEPERPAGGVAARRRVAAAGPVVGVLRVHTRRPEPGGELLL